MKKLIVNWFLPIIIDTIIQTFTTEQIKRWLDTQIDSLENYIDSSPTPLDDKFLPIIKMIREAVDIPDYEDEENKNESS